MACMRGARFLVPLQEEQEVFYKHRRLSYDRDALANPTEQQIRDINTELEKLPPIPWQVDAHAHQVLFTSGVLGALEKVFPKPKVKRKQQYVSPQQWQLA